MANKLSGLLEQQEQQKTNKLDGLLGQQDSPDAITAEQAEVDRREQLRSDLLDDIIFNSDKKEYSVGEQGFIAQEIIDTLNEPEDFRRDMTNNLILSEMFDLPLDQVDLMSKDMLREMYGDDLTNLAERFKTNPVEGGFARKMGEAVKRGNRAISTDVAFYQAFFQGEGDWRTVNEAANKMELEELLSPIEGNMVTSLFYASGQIAPGMVRGFVDAIPEAAFGMVAGAGMAFVAGQAGPQALLPEEAVTIPLATATGFKVGLKVGGFDFWYKQGAGSMARSMLNNGVDPNIAREMAGFAAVPYALIELSQATKLTPGLRKKVTNRIGKSIAGVVGRAVKTYGKTFTQEVIEEVQQEVVAIVADDIAAVLTEEGHTSVTTDTLLDIVSSLGGKVTGKWLKERSVQLMDTAKEASKGMALLPGGNFAVDVTSGTVSAVTEARRAKINENLPDIGALAQTRAELEAAKAGRELIEETEQAEATPAEPTEAEPTVTAPEPAEGLEAKQEGVVVPDLAVESEKFNTADEFVQSQNKVFHGTGASFEQFDVALGGAITEAQSAEKAVFFVDNPDVAQNYAVFAAERGDVIKKLKESRDAEKKAQRLQQRGKTEEANKLFDEADRLLGEAEELDKPDATSERRKTANVKEVVLTGDFLEVDGEGKTPQELSDEADIDSWLNEQLETAKAQGKDGVIFRNLDDTIDLQAPPATHYAVFSNESIKTEEQLIEIFNKNQTAETEIPEIPEAKRIISQEAFESAKARIKERRSRLTAGIDPGDLVDAAIIGGFFVETGVRKFGAWSAKMVSEFGEDIKSHLPKIWTDLQTERQVKAVEIAKKLPTKAPPVKAVKPTKIISPGQAGPFKVTFKATEDLPATRIVVDPKVARSIQSSETKLADLKTKLKQARADKKTAVVTATQKQIAKSELAIGKLKARQEIKVANTIDRARAVAERIANAKEFKDSLRRDAISVIRAIPKEDQARYILRASKVTTLKGLQNLRKDIETGVERQERQTAVKSLRAAAKAVKPKKMLPEFAKIVQPILDSLKEGSLREETKAKRSELAQLAKQVVDQSEPDSIEHVQATRMVADLAVKSETEIVIDDLDINEIQRLTEFLISMNFHNASDTIAAQGEKSKVAKERQKEVIAGTTKPGKVSKTAAGKTALGVKWLHDNLESMLDGVTGGRAGDYKIWAKGKSAFVKYVYDPINKGVDEQVRHTEDARNIMRQILVDNDVSKEDIVEWSARPNMKNDIKQKLGFGVNPVEHKIMLEDHNGKATEFIFTTNELMSIFMHSRNTHNLTTLRNQGMTRVDGKEIQEMFGFTSEKIAEIIGKLTDQQKNVARQVGNKLMDRFNRDAINKTSVQLQGFELATVDNYWPAKRYRPDVLKDVSTRRLTVELLENMGFLQERTGTGESLRMSGFFETAHDSNNNVAAYTGLAKPLREVKAVYNRTVFQHMKRNGRAHEADQINSFIRRLEQQAPQTTELDRMLLHLLGNFAKSKLFLNAKIAPRQYLSLGLLKAYVDAKYFTAVRGKLDKALVNELSELSPQLGRARFEGMQYDRDVGDEMAKNDLLFYLTGETSLVDKTALGIGFFDTLAILDVYRIAKAEVADNNPGIELTSAEGKVLLKDRFEWLARHTQPMWHVKDRSLIGSDKRFLQRSLTMFMSAREVIMRMNTNAVTEYLNSEQTVADGVRLGKVMGTVAGNMAMFTIYNFAWAALLQRKPKEVEDFYKDYFKDMLKLPFFGEYIEFFISGMVTSFATGKLNFFQRRLDEGPIEGTILSAFDAVINYGFAFNHLITGEKYKSGIHKGDLKWKNEVLVATDNLIDTMATLGGVPYYGASSFVKSINRQITGGKKKTKFVPTKRIK